MKERNVIEIGPIYVPVNKLGERRLRTHEVEERAAWTM